MLTETNQIEEFIKEYQRSRVITIASVRAALKRALDFENKFQKAFHEFSEDEVVEMYKSINAVSIRSIQNINLTLKHASRWILHSQNKPITNIYDNITKDIIQKCINLSKKEGLIINKEQLEEIQNDLLNYTDKAILFLLFEGVGGYKLKELTFMDGDQVSRKDLKAYFRSGKCINLTPEDYELLYHAFKEEELISFGSTTRVSSVKSFGIYKARFNSLSNNDDITDESDTERRYRFIQRRLILISKDLGITLTSGRIQESGLLHYLKQGVGESGLTFREYVKTEEAKALAKRYDILSDFAPQILLEKFEKYFA